VRFGWPQDPGQYLALVAALVALFVSPRVLRTGPRDRLFVTLSALAAAALSGAYVFAYLRGGPRIIDATSYFLEARALAQGHFSFPLDEPAASTMGRFLVRGGTPDLPTAAVLFPPGYPAFLAFGFLVGAPLAMGPVLAFGVTIATFHLAKRLFPEPVAGGFSLPRLATLLSVVCAALRYHTADTMSHGLAALLFTASFAFALATNDSFSSNRTPRKAPLFAGFCAGWLVATRPFSALALFVLLAFTFLQGPARPALRARLTTLALFTFGLLPGVTLLVLHQHAATGAFFTSSQRLYYALSDGPPGCFRYGFGKGIGCLGEHGEFVRHNLPNGFGPYAAAATTLRRLKQHLVDVGNAEPLFAFVPLGAFYAFTNPRHRLLVLGVLAQIGAYVPFYFDGNYPGGGARFFADALPLEFVLFALATSRLAEKARSPRLVAVLFALVLLGFGFRAGFDHALLRDREAGLPMFEPARVKDLPQGSLVFVDTDHGFNLGFSPGGRDHLNPNNLHIARFRGDGLDRMTWQTHGSPPAFRYRYSLPSVGLSDVRIEPISFDLQAPIVLEAESFWPPIAQSQGFAAVTFAGGPCVSNDRLLSVEPADPAESASFTIALPAPLLHGRFLAPRITSYGPASGALVLSLDGKNHTFAYEDAGDFSPRCVVVGPLPIPAGAENITLTLTKNPGPSKASLALDRIEVLERENH